MTKKKKKRPGLGQEEEGVQGLEGNGPLEGGPLEEAPGEEAPEEAKEPDHAAKLAKELEAARAEIAKLGDEYLLKCADLENYKKRLEREKAEHQSFANVELIRALLPAIDNLERALEHSSPDTSGGDTSGGDTSGEETSGEETSGPDTSNGSTGIRTLKHGIEITLKDALAVLAKFGLTDVPALFERFDPEVHEAVGHEEDLEHERDIVVRVLQKGYLLKERLIRPALVVVSSGRGGTEAPKEGSGDKKTNAEID